MELIIMGMNKGSMRGYISRKICARIRIKNKKECWIGNVCRSAYVLICASADPSSSLRSEMQRRLYVT